MHNKKLNNLGLDERNLTGAPNVITNLSNHTLTSNEQSALNKGLNFSILPPFFDFLQIQASFERLYQETRSRLCFKERIEFKRIIFNLYSKYKSGYFYSKHNKMFNLSEEELEALKNIRQNSSLIICKPDKGNGVVLLNKSDYVEKWNIF